jgi:hypothetical protein
MVAGLSSALRGSSLRTAGATLLLLVSAACSSAPVESPSAEPISTVGLAASAAPLQPTATPAPSATSSPPTEVPVTPIPAAVPVRPGLVKGNPLSVGRISVQLGQGFESCFEMKPGDAHRKTNCRIGVQWVDKADNETGYRVYVAAARNVNWQCGKVCVPASWKCSKDTRIADELAADTESTRIQLFADDFSEADGQIGVSCLSVVAFNETGESKPLKEGFYLGS